MQYTAQRQQKAANTSLLESRSLLQTATLVFPRPIVCSRLSNNINILAKKLSGRQRGWGAWPPAPGWIRHWGYYTGSGARTRRHALPVNILEMKQGCDRPKYCYHRQNADIGLGLLQRSGKSAEVAVL